MRGKKPLPLGSRGGVMVRGVVVRGEVVGGVVEGTLVSHQCGPGSIPGLGVIRRMSLLVLVLAPRGYTLGTPVSPKANISKFQFDPEFRGPRVCQLN